MESAKTMRRHQAADRLDAHHVTIDRTDERLYVVGTVEASRHFVTFEAVKVTNGIPGDMVRRYTIAWQALTIH